MDPGKDEPIDREAWRRLLGGDADGPPQLTDRRILAAARRALAPRAARWWLPASLAASVLLAVMLVQRQLDETGGAPLVTETEVLPAPMPVAVDAAVPAPDAMPRRQAMPTLESRSAPESSPPAVSAPQESARSGEQPAAMKSAADAPAAAGPRAPEEWYAEIEALRAAGRSEEAAAELARLEAAWPGWLARHHLPNR